MLLLCLVLQTLLITFDILLSLLYIVYVDIFDTSKLSKTLESLGIEDRQAELYLACVKIGGGTISELATEVNMERTSIYYHIGGLIKNGFLTTGSRGKRTIYLPADPAKLEDLFQAKQNEFLGLLPLLRDHYLKKTSKSITKSYQGAREMPEFFDALYELIKAAGESVEELWIIGHSYDVLTRSLKNPRQYRLAGEAYTKVKAIIPKSEKKKDPAENAKDPYLITYYGLPEAERKYLPDKYFFQGAIVISQDKVLTFDHNNLFGNITENHDLAQTWKMFFQFMWDNL